MSTLFTECSAEKRRPTGLSHWVFSEQASDIDFKYSSYADYLKLFFDSRSF